MLQLKSLRKAKKMTQAEVARYIGIGQSGYSDWERGETRIDSSSLKRLAELFGVTPGYILGDESDRGAIRVPILGAIPAGIPLEAIQDIGGWEEIPPAMAAGGKAYFALRVTGDSMWPEYLPGDIVILRREATCENGDVCAVYVNGFDAALKQVKLGEDGSLSIIPRNPAYPPCTYTPEEVATLPVSICGVVVELRRKIK